MSQNKFTANIVGVEEMALTQHEAQMNFEDSHLSFDHTSNFPSCRSGRSSRYWLYPPHTLVTPNKFVIPCVPQRAFGGPTQLRSTAFHMVALCALRRATTYGSPLTKGPLKW